MTAAQGEGKYQKLTGQDMDLSNQRDPMCQTGERHSTSAQAQNRLPSISQLLNRFPNSD